MRQDIEELFETMVQFGKIMSKEDPSVSHEKRAATMLQFSALKFVQGKKDAAVNELGTTLRLSKSSATQLIERLVKTGLIERAADKADRRIIRLSLTSKGEKEVVKMKNRILKKIEKIFSYLPEQDIKELVRIHKTLIANFEKENA